MLLLASFLLGAARAAAPNTSLATLPVGYYGSSWPVKDAAHIDLLSRLRFVVLMQQDGECWVKCCPHANGGPKCAHPRIQWNASENPGCDPSCDQHGTQDAVFARIGEHAKSQGRSPPHFIIYMNAVYDWPFDAAHAGGESVDLLDAHGRPHMEMCDPGIYPSFFRDYSKPAGRKAFVGEIDKYVVKGAADGVYLDCFDSKPVKCLGNGTCVAIRNPLNNTASVITAAHVAGYIAGRTQSFTGATALVAEGSGGMFLTKRANMT